jgi:hypothetical protein
MFLNGFQSLNSSCFTDVSQHTHGFSAVTIARDNETFKLAWVFCPAQRALGNEGLVPLVQTYLQH